MSTVSATTPANTNKNTARHGVFYPSMVVNLTMRFDENLLSGNPLPSPTAIPDFSKAPGTCNTKKKDKPQFNQGSNDASKDTSIRNTQIFGIVPKSAAIELPGVRQAGTFSLTIDYRELPIDPRLIRSAGVQIHLDAVDGLKFGNGMLRKFSDGRSRPVIATTTNRLGMIDTDTLVIMGVVDNWVVTHNASVSEVEISGRDLRAILINSPIDATSIKHLDLTKPINDVVCQIIGMHPFGKDIIVAANASEFDGNVIPSPAGNSKNCRVLLSAGANSSTSPTSNKPTTNPPGDATQMNMWFLITQYCQLVGAVPHFIGNELRIRPARYIWAQETAGFDPTTNPTPFAGGVPRTIPGDPAPKAIRVLMYGNNIDELKFERHYTGFRGVVHCISVATCSKQRGVDGKIVEAFYPDVPKDAKLRNVKELKTHAEASGGASQTEEIVISVPGIKTKTQLKQIARDIFEEIMHGEIGGSCSTRSVTSLGGGNNDPDLLRMRPGDAIEFRTDTRTSTGSPPFANVLVDDATLTEQELAKKYSDRLGDNNLARAIAASQRIRTNPLLRFFRVNTVRFKWNWDSGLGIDFDFQNYVATRFNIDPVLNQTLDAIRMGVQNLA